MAPVPGSVRRRPRPAHRSRFLRMRETGRTEVAPPQLRRWIEGDSLRRLDVGEYIPLGRSSDVVRSTISIAFSHDGRFFASTHGDHTVKVCAYPSLELVCSLDGHPRTPWTVRFHPTDPNIIASGCLGGDVFVWDVAARKCVRKHTFATKISCVAFHPDGDRLAVTAGFSLFLWAYSAPSPDGDVATHHAEHAHPVLEPEDLLPGRAPAHPALPLELLRLGDAKGPFKLVDFHPSGHWLLTGVSNHPAEPPDHAPTALEEQFSVRLELHRFNRRLGVSFAQPVHVIPRAVAYNDAGVHFSPCGTRLAACVPVADTPRHRERFRIAVFSVRPATMGRVLHSKPISRGHVTALTNIKFSATGEHLLAAFSFRKANPVLRMHARYVLEWRSGRVARLDHLYPAKPERAQCGAPLHEHPRKVNVVDIYRVCPAFPLIRSLSSDVDMTSDNAGGAEDEINVAVFAPALGVASAVLYGTQKGRIRIFRMPVSRTRVAHGVCDENCRFRAPQSSLRSLLNPAPPLGAPAPPYPAAAATPAAAAAQDPDWRAPAESAHLPDSAALRARSRRRRLPPLIPHAPGAARRRHFSMTRTLESRMLETPTRETPTLEAHGYVIEVDSRDLPRIAHPPAPPRNSLTFERLQLPILPPMMPDHRAHAYPPHSRP